MLAFAAREVTRIAPGWMLDIGGSKALLAVLSQFTCITSLDVRPWRHCITGLEVLRGNILALPYEDGAIGCIMALSVIEHISLSRYDSALDPLGTVKACAELVRVVAPGGHLILAAPISHTPGVAYCAHRLHTRAKLLSYFPAFHVEREVALYPEPGPPERVSELGEWGYAMWCGCLVKEGENAG